MTNPVYAILSVLVLLTNSNAQNPWENAIDFGSVDDTFYIDIRDDESLDLTTQLTLEAWIYFRSYSGSWNVIIDKDYDQYGLYVRSSGVINLYMIGNFGTISLDGNTVMNTDTWYHTAATYDSATGKARVYVNGHLDGEISGLAGTLNKSDGPLRIGDDFSNDTAFDGLIGEVRVWHIARDSSQLQQTMNTLLGPVYLTAGSGLVGYWPLNEAAGDTVTDLSFYDNFGIIVGGDFAPTGIDNTFLSGPKNFILNQNYPNPFNNNTVISYYLNRPSQVSMEIFNSAGQRISQLFDTGKSAGDHHYNFDARNLASGIYIVQLRAAGQLLQQKVILVK